MDERLEQLAKAANPISVTLSGIWIDDKLLQEEKASCPILSIEVGKTMLDKYLHSKKRHSGILLSPLKYWNSLKELGVVTDVNDASSAANVGYVNSVAMNVANEVNRGFNKVNDRINEK